VQEREIDEGLGMAVDGIGMRDGKKTDLSRVRANAVKMPSRHG
jgi:hypothetical protein